MICHSCYKPTKYDFCPNCRNRLFQKGKVTTAILDFDSPSAENLPFYQEHSKRLSISGVQLKYGLKMSNGKLVLSNVQSEFILKPVPVGRHLTALESAPENEHLTMQIANQIFNIPIAANALVFFRDGQPAYITRRFDLREDGSKFLQEDFTQLLSKSKISHGEHFKYEGCYADIATFMKKHVAAYLPQVELLFKTVLFNYLLSNGDAHLKNFSLYRTETNEFCLTPAYDLLSTLIHSPTESDTALTLYPGDLESSDYLQLGYYGLNNFIHFAQHIGIIEKRAKKTIASFISKKDQVIQMVHESFLSQPMKKKYLSNLDERFSRFGESKL